MRIAIMQPYLFPYIGYYQLIKAADKFVFLDDVNFINRGWINRNNILVNGKANLFTVPLQNASQNKRINEVEVAEGNWKDKLLQTIEMAYKKAPCFNEVFPVVKSVFYTNEHSIAGLAKQSICQVISYLDLKKEIVDSANVYNNEALKGEARIININSIENSTHYINPIGGTKLYEPKHFAEKDIKLQFLKTRNFAYKQMNNEFVPQLSMIDVLMFNNRKIVLQYLEQFDLIT
jgi:WbqC-like protein family